MKNVLKFFIELFLVFVACQVQADTAYQHFSTEELKLANRLVKSMKSGNEKEYDDYVVANESLEKALKICQHGLKQRLRWDEKNGGYRLEDNVNANKFEMGKMVYEFIKRTKTVIVFTDGFGSKSGTGGGMINAHWQLGEMDTLGKGGTYADAAGNIQKHDRYKFRKYNVVWISADYKDSPVSIALLLAHEMGHGLAEEYRLNYPLPLSGTDKPPYTFFPTDLKYDDEMWCYPFEGMMAEELGLTTNKELHLDTRQGRKTTSEAYDWYIDYVGGDKRFPKLYEQLRIQHCLNAKLEYLAGSTKNRRCGMRCKYFNQYQYCDNVVKRPPCHLWKKHLESWTAESPQKSVGRASGRKKYGRARKSRRSLKG